MCFCIWVLTFFYQIVTEPTDHVDRSDTRMKLMDLWHHLFFHLYNNMDKVEKLKTIVIFKIRIAYKSWLREAPSTTKLSSRVAMPK